MLRPDGLGDRAQPQRVRAAGRDGIPQAAAHVPGAAAEAFSGVIRTHPHRGPLWRPFFLPRGMQCLPPALRLIVYLLPVL